MNQTTPAIISKEELAEVSYLMEHYGDIMIDVVNSILNFLSVNSLFRLSIDHILYLNVLLLTWCKCLNVLLILT